MHKLLTFLLLISSIYAKENYEIVAKKIDSKNDLIYANGDVVIFSQANYMTADRAIYDKENGIVELFGNVVIIKNNKISLVTDYSYINLKEDINKLEPFLLYSNDKNIWINSKSANKEKDLITLESSIISSCDCENPAWSFKFSSGDYDTNKEWINTFNTRLYIKSVPLFYTPYFGFPTNKERRSGLLPPTVGYSNNEGFLYSQPLFIAPKENYDFEFIPQTRGHRGNGLFAFYRYSDSLYSTLKIQSGIFNEKLTYQDRYNLKNSKHYGYDLEYDRSNLFSDNSLNKDSIYTSLHWLNDIEYKNLEKDQDSLSYNQKIESKINYYFNTPNYYFGTYFRYYIDTTLDSNKETMQQLPQLHLHNYDKTLFNTDIKYSFDAKLTNFSRDKGLNAYQYDLNLPFSYSTSFFDDYINFNFKEVILSTYIDYNKQTINYDNAYFSQNKHILNLGTDLLKPYDSFIHTINLYSEYTIPNTISKSGDIYKITNSSQDLSYFPVDKEDKILSFGINQIFYDKESLTDIVQHKIKQSIIYDDYNNADLLDLENEFVLKYSPFTFSNKTIYNHKDNRQTESSTNFSFNYKNFTFDTNYYLSKDTPNSGKLDSESYSMNLGYNIFKDYSISYYENYNVNENIRNKQILSLGINDSCWNLNIKLEKSIVASSTIDNSAIRQNIIYFNVLLKPFAQFKQKYNIKSDNK